ncbi:MAG: sulfotransferase [Pikeienuella sp.]
MKKLFLCVGAAKTGTTWLYNAIRRNPDIWFTPEKELHHHFSAHGRFDRLTQEIRDQKLARALEWAEGPGREALRRDERVAWYRRFAAGPVSDEWYRGLFAEAPEGAWAADFSPSTSLLPDAGWTALAGFAPEIRIVYILREPLSRLWSHAKFHASFTGRFDEFRRMDRKEMRRFIDRYNLTEDGDYGSHLSRIYAHFPREHVLLIDYERIAREPEAVLREVEAHIGARKTPFGKDKLGERINVSESLKAPWGFGASYRGQFAREAGLLVDLGVEFARPWAERHAAGATSLRARIERALGY